MGSRPPQRFSHGGASCVSHAWVTVTYEIPDSGLYDYRIVPSDQNCGWSLERFPASAEDVIDEPSPRYGVGTRTATSTVRSNATPPPLPRDGSFRVRDTAGVEAATHTLNQQ
ncbi:MAG: hypothetical protein OEW19_01840 [Acidobacteriota bacterium]|nr:hypothetical protein [Acidobacteriota bacterium]